MRILIIFALALVLTTVGLAAAQDVKTDYNHQTDFSKYKTFTWIKEPKTTNPLMKQRIMDAINLQLGEKGLRLVADHADLGVSANTATREERTLESFYNGFPGGWRWHRWYGPGSVTAYVDTYQVGTLVLDLFDTATKQVVWWGTASDTISDKAEKNTEHLNKAVVKMFKEFPPKADRKTE